MTAIAADYTTSGFAIAADGKRHSRPEIAGESSAQSKPSLHEQKVFKIQNPGRVIAYALSGTISSDDKKFNLIAKTKRCADMLAVARCGDPWEYIHRFSGSISEGFIKARRRGSFRSFLTDDYLADSDGTFLVATIIFLGYYEHSAFWGTATVRHRNQTIVDPTIWVETPVVGGNVIWSGSRVIYKMIFELKDVRFANYIGSPREHNSLTETVARVKGWIEGQCSSEAAALDAFCREQVGGHIHIATVTPNGFRWEIRPTR